MITPEVLARATEIAQKIIDAYGKDPAEYDAREQQALSAFAYGSIFTYYFEEVAGIPPKLQTMAEFQALMMIFNRQFLYDLNVTGHYFGFLLQCTKKGYHPSMYAVIHLGIDGYDFLDRPEQLREGLHGMIKSLNEPMPHNPIPTTKARCSLHCAFVMLIHSYTEWCKNLTEQTGRWPVPQKTSQSAK